jgi:hypothetical protein
LEESGSVWKSGLGLFSGIVSELFGVLGIDNGNLAFGSLQVDVSSGSGGGGNESWDWWDWWESNSGSLPGDWVLKLEEGRGIWKSGLGLIGGLISELLRVLGINDGYLSFSSLLVGVGSSGSGGGDESWDWWDWWESNSRSLPGDWVLELNEGRCIWESSLGLISGLISELLGVLGIDNGNLAFGSLQVDVSSGSGGGGNESWDWWDWWESNSGSLPGDWILHLEESRGIWKSGLGLISGLIGELLRSLSVNNGFLTIGTLLVEVSDGSGGGSDESWNWWDWWESNSLSLPGDWILNLDIAGSNELLWTGRSDGLSHGLLITIAISELVSNLSILVFLLAGWSIKSKALGHFLSLKIALSEFVSGLSIPVSLLSSWTVDDNAFAHLLSLKVAISKLVLGIGVFLLAGWSIKSEALAHLLSLDVSVGEFSLIEESNSNVASWLVMVVFTDVNSLGLSKEKSHNGS